MQETPNGFFYLCLPEDTLIVCKQVAEKTGQSVGEVIADAIVLSAKTHGVLGIEKSKP